MPSKWDGLTTSYTFKHATVVPMGREGVIVFPTNKTTGKIDYSAYRPTMTKNLIPVGEVANFLRGIDVFVQPVFTVDLVALQSRLWRIFAIVVVVVLVLAAAILAGVSETSVLSSVVSIIACSIIIIVGAVLFVQNHTAVTEVKKKIQESKEKVEVYLQHHKYNGPFQAAGYFWAAPDDFPYWIELCTATPGQEIQQPMGLNMEQQYMMHPQQQQSPIFGESHFNSPLQVYSLA